MIAFPAGDWERDKREVENFWNHSYWNNFRIVEAEPQSWHSQPETGKRDLITVTGTIFVPNLTGMLTELFL